VIIEFENGCTAVAEDSWAKHGGMDDRCEVYGTGGVMYADLFMGNAAITIVKMVMAMQWKKLIQR
jgi:predicted dehydrogenase